MKNTNAAVNKGMEAKYNANINNKMLHTTSAASIVLSVLQ